MNENVENFSESVFTAISSVKTNIIQFIPELMSAFAILIFGILIAYFLKWASSVFVRGLSHVLPKKFNERTFIQENLPALGKGLGQLLFFITLFLTLTASMQKLGFTVVSDWLQHIARFLPNIVGSIFIVFLGWKLKEFLSDVIFKALNQSGFSHARVSADASSWSLFVISCLLALEQIGIDMSLIIMVISILLGVASAGVALTFALGAKATISDILYCYQLHKFLSVGQEIEISGHSGTVKSIGPMFVILQTEQGRVTLPGSLFCHEAAIVKSGES